MCVWKFRLHASAIHLFISLTIATLAALLVFGWWYPYPYREISGGRELFVLVVAVDVVLGPLITLVIFNATKTRRHLMMDFTVIGLLQVAALSYGLWTVFVARPVHLVFEYRRMAVVHAVDIEPEMLAKAPPGLQKLPLLGPTLLSLRPLQGNEAIESILQATGGIPQAAQPNLWQSYEAAQPQILQESQPVVQLRSRFPAQTDAIDLAIAQTGKNPAELRYLPLLSRKLAWTVLIDAKSAQPVGFVALDSF
ncbi:MAG: pilus assembly protein [Burkholderiaceae bacterium]|nr:pilus assembly protein [Burkholderiaceae bacterium]